jgi:uncharacterized protein
MLISESVPRLASHASQSRLPACLALAWVLAASLWSFPAFAFDVKEAPAGDAPKQERGLFKSVGDALNEGIRGLKSGNPTLAVEPLTFAAQEGSVPAQWKLGRMYSDGEGVPRDEYKAYQLFSQIVNNRADESPDSPQARVVANAFVALGGYHLTGIPNSRIKRNPARASEMFHYAASYFGDTEAQFRLGKLMAEGMSATKDSPALPKDPQQGVKWLKLAAEKGHVPAQAWLGKILYNGDGVPKQAALGLMWMRMAADRARPHEAWVRDWHESTTNIASEDEVRLSETYMKRHMRGTAAAVQPRN